MYLNMRIRYMNFYVFNNKGTIFLRNNKTPDNNMNKCNTSLYTSEPGAVSQQGRIFLCTDKKYFGVR